MLGRRREAFVSRVHRFGALGHAIAIQRTQHNTERIWTVLQHRARNRINTESDDTAKNRISNHARTYAHGGGDGLDRDDSCFVPGLANRHN